MSKYAGFAKRLDEAFRAARDEYKSAHDKLKEAEKNRSNGNPGSAQRQRAELDYQDAKTEFRDAERRIWGEFTRTRADLRRELAERVAADSSANPDTVDANGLELLKSGILTANDFYALAEKYDDNPTMLRLLAKYARDAASDPSNDQATRGALYMLSERCADGCGAVMGNWDALFQIADYCSGQAHERTGSPSYTLSMSEWWEQLSGEAVENF